MPTLGANNVMVSSALNAEKSAYPVNPLTPLGISMAIHVRVSLCERHSAHWSKIDAIRSDKKP